jgi:hypothetical protein
LRGWEISDEDNDRLNVLVQNLQYRLQGLFDSIYRATNPDIRPDIPSVEWYLGHDGRTSIMNMNAFDGESLLDKLHNLTDTANELHSCLCKTLPQDTD